MANFNKVILIGRLTRDPESRTFSNGGKVTKFGFAASPSRRKNAQTGQFEDEPMFIDCEAFNRGEFGKLADIIEQYCRKGSLICIEGRLHLDQWDDKTTGQKRSKHKVVVDTMQLLESKQESEARRAGGGMAASSPTRSAEPDSFDEPPQQSSGEDIPF